MKPVSVATSGRSSRWAPSPRLWAGLLALAVCSSCKTSVITTPLHSVSPKLAGTPAVVLGSSLITNASPIYRQPFHDEFAKLDTRGTAHDAVTINKVEFTHQVRPNPPAGELPLVFLSFFLPFLGTSPGAFHDQYRVEYSALTADGQLFLGDLQEKLEGAYGGWYVGRIYAFRELSQKAAQFVSQNAARLIVDDLYRKHPRFQPGATKPPEDIPGEVVRKTTEPPGQPPLGPIRQHWALLIGVSKFRDARVPTLAYAAADAKAMRDWLISPKGGRYPPENVRLLVDEEATLGKIKEALNSWLQQAEREDMVTLYFAGHGSAESPQKPGNLYLLPSDVRYDDLPSTGLPMWDFASALKNYIKARRVVILTDSCHAAGVGDAFQLALRSNPRGIKVQPVDASLLGQKEAPEASWCVLSASSEDQLSSESAEWGGHGVFTHFLLKGLGGAADTSQDGKVTVGELSPYLSEEVRRATRSLQTPKVSGNYDPNLRIGK